MAGDSGVSLDQTSQDTAEDVDMPALHRESDFNFVWCTLRAWLSLIHI